MSCANSPRRRPQIFLRLVYPNANRWSDPLIVNGDPLADMRLLANKDNVDLVVKDGVPLVDRMGLADQI